MIASDDRYLLDLCLIRVNPQLNLDVEHIRYPENLLRQLRMEADISEDGVVIAGTYIVLRFSAVGVVEFSVTDIAMHRCLHFPTFTRKMISLSACLTLLCSTWSAFSRNSRFSRSMKPVFNSI